MSARRAGGRSWPAVVHLILLGAVVFGLWAASEVPTASLAQEAPRPAGWNKSTHGADVEPDYKRLFATDRVHELRMTIAPDRFRAMQADLETIVPAGVGRLARQGIQADLDSGAEVGGRAGGAAFSVGAIQYHLRGGRGEPRVVAKRNIRQTSISHRVDMRTHGSREGLPGACLARSNARLMRGARVGDARTGRDGCGVVADDVGCNQAVHPAAVQCDRETTSAESQQTLADRIHELDVGAGGEQR